MCVLLSQILAIDNNFLIIISQCDASWKKNISYVSIRMEFSWNLWWGAYIHNSVKSSSSNKDFYAHLFN